VPDKTKVKEDGDGCLLKLISVKLAPKSTMKVVPHTFTNSKNFLLYQIQHNYTLHQQETQPKWIPLNLVLNDTEVRFAAINANSEDVTNTTNYTLKKLEDLHGYFALKMNVVVVKAFSPYQQMSSPALLVEWGKILEEICLTKG
jgi:hypothetical protein